MAEPNNLMLRADAFDVKALAISHAQSLVQFLRGDGVDAGNIASHCILFGNRIVGLGEAICGSLNRPAEEQ